MELGLTLGSDASSTPFGFQIKATGTNTSTTTTITAAATELGLGLGINNSNGRKRQQLSRGDHHGSTRSNGDRTVHIDPRPSLHLDLLPVTPVPRNTIQGFSWPSENANTGSSDGGSSGQIGAAGGRGFDVNRLPPAAAEEAEAVSSPNSVASSFQMDFGIFRGSKRDSETGGGSNDGGGDPAERTSSRASDDDDNGLTRKKLRLSKEQSAFLEESFKEHNTLNPKQKLALAKQLSLRPRQVEVWFQNRRARTKLKQTEVDCEYLKRCCETLTEENRRLHKELQELRALKSSNPYYMQLPATTLTMCPSCERVATTTTTTAATSSATGVTVASNISTDPSSKATAFPLSRPKFYPFSSHNQPQKSAAS